MTSLNSTTLVRRDFRALEHQWHGNVPGEILGITGNGKPVDVRMLHVWEFKNGRVSRKSAWLGRAAIVAQLTGEPTS